MKTKSGISYQTRVTVYLDGKPIGEIREEMGTLPGWNGGKPGFRYYPKGQKIGGELYTRLEHCQAHLV